MKISSAFDVCEFNKKFGCIKNAIKNDENKIEINRSKEHFYYIF